MVLFGINQLLPGEIQPQTTHFQREIDSICMINLNEKSTTNKMISIFLFYITTRRLEKINLPS